MWRDAAGLAAFFNGLLRSLKTEDGLHCFRARTPRLDREARAMPDPDFIAGGRRWEPARRRASRSRPTVRYARGMGVQLPDDWADLLTKAIAHYWQTLDSQAEKQTAGSADRGRRSAVTGGKQMDGFCSLVASVAAANGMSKASIYTSAKLEIPGYFRPTKQWDLIVIDRGYLVAALEFKSQRGPSFGNNFNNRTEEALGNASDLWTAYREGAFGTNRPAPWLGWIMMLEDCPGSSDPVSVAEPHFKVFPEFRGTSYSARYQILLRKLLLEKLYNAAAFLTATSDGGAAGKFAEPADDLSMRAFLLALGGNIATHVALSNKS